MPADTKGPLPGAFSIPELRTERLLLRAPRESDIEAAFVMNGDAQNMRYYPQPLTREENDAWMRRIPESWQKYGLGRWVVEVPGVTAFIGVAGLDRPAWDPSFVELAWRLTPVAQGKGYATEAARAACRFAFETLGLETLAAFTAASNTPSQRVMERLGMTRDPAADFDHPNVPDGHPLQRHVLYRLQWQGTMRTSC